MKNKTIWTYIKRTLLITVALVVVISVSIFFLGKYKAADVSYENKYNNDFWPSLQFNGSDPNGFLYSSEISNEISKRNINSQKYELPFVDGMTLKEKLNAAEYDKELDRVWESIQSGAEYKRLSNAKKNELLAEYEAIKATNLPTWEEYSIPLQEEEVLNNGKYRLIFNKISTAFRLENLQNGEVWYSNPQVLDEATSEKKKESSLMNVVFVSGDKSQTPVPTTFYSSHSTDENVKREIIPSYYVRFDENKETLIVYYVFQEGGINYTYFPEVMTNARFDELCNRSIEKVKEAYDNGIVLKDRDNKVITGIFLNGSLIGKRDKLEFTEEEFELTRTFHSRIFQTIYREQVEETGQWYCTKCYSVYDGKPEVCTHDHSDGLESTSFAEVVKYSIGGGQGGTSHKNLGDTDILDLTRFFYDWCDYTEEDLIQDTGSERADSGKPVIGCAIEYSLTDDGLQVMVPGNSVKSNTDAKGHEYRVVSIDVLPYFTSVKENEDTGYMIIPDGSGAIVNFDNGKAEYPAYLKRLYSTDLAFTSFTKTSKTTDILLPMYAFAYTGSNKGIVVEAAKGASQISLNAGVSGRASGNNTFNYAYYTINYRETEQVIFGTNTYNRVKINQYTQRAASGDYEIQYNILDNTKYDVDYSGIAKFYRDLLVKENASDDSCLAKLDVNKDQTNNASLDLEVIGAYEYRDNFAGIVYEAKGTLTTVEQLDIIMKDIADLGINISKTNVYYKGWRNVALSNVSFKNIKVNGKIGGRKALLNYINESKENDITIYPYLEFLEYNKFQESFGRTHYTSRDVSGSHSEKYPYDLNTNTFNVKAPKIMTLSPKYYHAFAEELADNYLKALKGVNSIAISGLGSQLSGDYKRGKEIFKYSAVEEQVESLNTLYNKGINDIALMTPYAYALPYVSKAYNVPTVSSGQEILDYEIPFYQLVVNGMFDYSSEAINANSEISIDRHIMKCIETGSNPAFTFTYDDSSKLLQTDYNKYYYTYYSRWLQDVQTVCNTLNNLHIYECNLAKHERLANNVYKVTYVNKANSQKLEIILNYQRTPWQYDANHSVMPSSYLVIE